MGQGSRPERIADQIRAEVSSMIARDLQDPGIGFTTITRVQVSPDLQHARVFYSTLGDTVARKNTARALERAESFMRRQLGQRLRLRRAPELEFVFDESIAHQDRVEQLLQELRETSSADSPASGTPEPHTPALDDESSE
jgi:ribosome-binding factor A